MSGRCTSCPAAVPDGSRFCPGCGAPVTPSSDIPTLLADRGVPPRTAAGPPSPPASARRIHTTPGLSRSGPASSSDPHGESRFMPGMVISGRYRVIGLLGRGGMGEVYRADDLKLGQAVALKFLPEMLAADQDRLARFYQEVRISRAVSHSNVCRVHDIDEYEGQPFLSMEYIDGEDLASLLKRIGRLPKEKAVQIARQICAGLSAAHDKGILHRDLKPANILIDGRGHARITDFGLAGVAHELVGDEVRAGTPAYMAPEQLAGKEVTVRSDVYSLGLTLYEIFTGKAAFDARSTKELIRLQTDTTPASPATFVEGFDPAVERVIFRCLEREPRDRPPTALSVAAALPGGDPLAAALAAGETPSPQMVADAGEEGALRPGIALALTLVVLAGLVAQLFVSRGMHLVHRVATPRPPAVLEADAKRIVASLGYEADGKDSTYGFETNQDPIQEIQRNDSGPRRWDRLRQLRPSPMRFWYRQSPRHLVPSNFRGNVSAADPPVTLAGMVSVELDPEGRLVSFTAVPPQVDENRTDPAPAPDWSLLFAAAQLEMASFQAAAPAWNPTLECDSRSAWTGAFPDQPEVPIRIEACGYGGKPAWFFIAAPWTRPALAEDEDSPAVDVLAYAILAFVLCLLAAAAFLAWRSLRLGRGDRTGGFRLAIYVFTLMFASDLLRRHHVASLSEVGILFDTLAWDLLLTAIVWLLYQGLEPYVRRVWPHLLITWTRLLSGRLKDPRLGRDILVGGCAFAASILLQELNLLALRSLALPELPVRMTGMAALSGNAGTAATWLQTILNPLIGPLLVTFTLLILRVILRRMWLAMGVLALFFSILVALGATTQVPAGSASVVPYALVLLVFSLLDLAILFTVVVRFGYLAFVFASLFANPANFFPLTTDFSAWYAAPAALTVVPLAAVALYGFHLARAGRPVIDDALLHN